jgi:cyanophycin synthetase
MKIIKNTNHLILLKAAKKLGLKTKIISHDPVKIEYSSKSKTHLISQKSFGLNSEQPRQISKDKALALQTLALNNLPTPRHVTVSSPQNYQDVDFPFPQVIKPSTGEKGKHVYLNIKNIIQGQEAVEQILSHYPEAQIETYHQGNDYRFLCLNFKLIGIAQRLPPTITGDGQNTIKQLIETENQHRFNQNKKLGRRMLNRMRNWTRLDFNLNLQGLSLQAVLLKNKTITLYPIPNFSTGGSVKAIDPKTIHPSIVNLAETTAKTIGLNICGIDMIIKPSTNSSGVDTPESKNSLQDLPSECWVIEVNSDPGLRLHDWPNQGKSQHVAEAILQSIFNI